MAQACICDDVLTGKATITKLVRRNPKNGLVEITIEVYNQDGILVLSDVTEAIVKCRNAQWHTITPNSLRTDIKTERL